MTEMPTLDAHAHFDPRRSTAELAEAGAVLAMSLSLDEAEQVIGHYSSNIAWGVGCHPRKLQAQQAFDPDRFAELAMRTAIIGEVGIDTGYRVPLDLQLRTLRAVLSFAAKSPRIVSLHSYNSCSLLLTELERTPVVAPILHWWTGNASETMRAVNLGCYFSVHSAVARRSLFRTQVPLDRLLVESDHGWGDSPGAIPHRVIWVEYLLSASIGMDVREIRQLVWLNFKEIVRLTGTSALLPISFADLINV